MTTATRPRIPYLRVALAEFLGTATLLAVIVGSGIAASRLSPGDTGVQLLEHSLAIALGLGVLIVVFQPISGSHFNPVVTLALLPRTPGPASAPASLVIAAQLLGALAGTIAVNATFGVPTAISDASRATVATVFAESLATAGLILLVLVLVRTGRAHLAGPAVAAYIFAAIWFTSSTSFANPAVTFGRVFTDTFSGIDPASAMWFMGAQLVGAAIGVGLARVLVPPNPRDTLRQEL